MSSPVLSSLYLLIEASSQIIWYGWCGQQEALGEVYYSRSVRIQLVSSCFHPHLIAVDVKCEEKQELE
jgi:hypothetical protein